MKIVLFSLTVALFIIIAYFIGYNFGIKCGATIAFKTVEKTIDNLLKKRVNKVEE